LTSLLILTVMSGVLYGVKRFFGLNQTPGASRKRPLDRDSEDDDLTEASSGKKQKLEETSQMDASPYSPSKLADTIIISPIKSLVEWWKSPVEEELGDWRTQAPVMVDMTEEQGEGSTVRQRSKNSLNSEIKSGRSMGLPVTIQASEPTRLDSDQNEVHLLKVVNPNTSGAAVGGTEEPSSIQYDSPLKAFGGFSENVIQKCPSPTGASGSGEKHKRFTITTSKEKERRKKNTSPGALTKQIRTGYMSAYDKFFYSERNATNRKTIGDRFKKFNKRKMSTAVKETFNLADKVKYWNIINNLSSSNKTTNFVPYTSPGFSTLMTPMPGIIKEKADATTTKIKTDRILTSTAMKPNIFPVISLDSSFETSKTLGGASGACKTPTPGFKNSMEESLKNNPVYSPMFLKELRSKYDRKARETNRSIAEQEIKKSFYEEKHEETNTEMEERILKHMKITSVDVEDLDSTASSQEEELELPEITPEMEEVIQRARRSKGEVLVDSHKIQITRKDIDTLNGLNWLNDEIINFYLQMIVDRSAEKGLKVYATNTFFYPKMMDSGQPALKRWTKRVDIFEKDIMLIPVHLGMHWCLAVVDFRKPGVYYYDSMGGNNNKCLTTLLKYLQDEHRDKKGKELDIEKWEHKIRKDIPQQMNGSDCGMFACKFAEYISRGASISFTQQDMPYFRRRMIWEIVKDTLLHP